MKQKESGSDRQNKQKVVQKLIIRHDGHGRAAAQFSVIHLLALIIQRITMLTDQYGGNK